MVSTMPSAVSGLTKLDAPSAAVVPAASARHWSALTQRYCEYIPPPAAATILPFSACAAGDAPAAMTSPAPSFPTGSDCPTRPAIARIAFSGIAADTTGSLGVPPCNVVRSAAPKSMPRSDGLMGAASTRSTTSSGAGSGVST